MRKQHNHSRGFKEWLRLDEVSDPSRLDTSDINLKKGFSGYTYEFDYHSPNDPTREAQHFEVKMVGGKTTDYGGVQLPREVSVYNIAFSGPHGFSLTGQSGPEATAIYGRLLASIKKLMETENVDALSFSAANPRMTPMYDAFLKKLLPDFTQVDSSTYVHKQLLNDVLDSLPENQREEMVRKIATVHREREEEIAIIKKHREEARLNRRIAAERKRGASAATPRVQAGKGPELSMGS